MVSKMSSSRSSRAACLVFAALAGVLTSGCALVPGLRLSASDSDLAAKPAYEVVNVTPAVIASELSASRTATLPELVAVDYAGKPSEYLIGPGDVLQIVVWDHPELTNPFGAVTRDPVTAGQLVGADGNLYYPYMGVFPVAGKTVQEVRRYISDQISRVISRPQVDVRVVAFRAQRIQVTGEVQQPGAVTLDDTTKGLLEAIGERGGLTSAASRRRLVLVRNGTSYQIDLAGLLSGSRPGSNPLLRGGDVVHVPDAGDDQVFVLGEVARQGPVVMSQQPLSLTEALTKTGGLDKLSASDSGLLIFRRPDQANQPARIYTLDLARPEGMLLAGEFTLRPRDVVYVKATAFAQYNLVINQLLPTISSIYQVDSLVNRGR